MAIILKNDLDSAIVWVVPAIPSASGTLGANGKTVVLPEGSEELVWTSDYEAVAGTDFKGNTIEMEDNYIYTVSVTKTAMK